MAPEMIAVVVVIVILLIVMQMRRENAIFMNSTAGGPDNVVYTGVLASGPERELELPSKAQISRMLTGSSRAYPLV